MYTPPPAVLRTDTYVKNEPARKSPGAPNTAALAPSTDPFDWKIAPAVKDKLRRFRDAKSDRYAALARANREVDDIRARRDTLQARLGLLRDDGIDDGDLSVREIRAELDRCTDDLKRNDERRKQLSQSWREASALFETALAYVKALGASAIVEHSAAKIALPKGETAKDAAVRSAQSARSIAEEIAAVRTACLRSDVVKAKARSELQRLAATAKPNIEQLLNESAATLQFPTELQLVNLGQGATFPGSVRIANPVALFAWVFPNEIAAAIDREIDLAADDRAALTDDERATKIAQLTTALLSAQRQEARFCELADELPRADLDVRAILNLVDAAVPRFA